MFSDADEFITKVKAIEAVRKRLSPQTKTFLKELGSIAAGAGGINAALDPTPLPDVYFSAAAAYWAYLYSQLALLEIDVASMSQLVGGAPTCAYPSGKKCAAVGGFGGCVCSGPNYPSVTMIDAVTGKPTARWFVLKMLVRAFGNRVKRLVRTSVDVVDGSASAPFAQAFEVTEKDGSKSKILLLVNKNLHASAAVAAGAFRCMESIDGRGAWKPPALTTLAPDSSVSLELFGVAILTEARCSDRHAAEASVPTTEPMKQDDQDSFRLLPEETAMARSTPSALLWPLPKSTTFGSGVAVLAANASFFGAAPSALLERAFARYAELLPTCDGRPPDGAGVISSFTLRVADPEASGKQQPICTVGNLPQLTDAASLTGPSEFMDESYELFLPSQGAVLVKAATQWGALRALETFSQLAENCTLQGTPMRVVDTPRFTHRGIMLDLARRFWPESALFPVLDEMAHSKLNVLHLHLTDAESFMFESLAYPELNRAAFRQPTCTGPYTRGDGSPCLYRQAMLRRLVAAAADRGIRVLPELDMPAHAESWGVAFPEIVVNGTCLAGGLSNVLINPFLNQTWRVVGAVLAEVAAIFPDERLHLGADEVCWRCYNHSTEVRAAIVAAGRALDDDGFKWVIRRFLARAQAIVSSLGRNSSVWNEAFGIYGPGNYGFQLGDHPDARTYSINTELAPATAVQHWWGGTGAWYNTFTGRPDSANASAVISHGQMYINSEGWYLPIGAPRVWPYNWSSMYRVDPATNKTCTYPPGGPAVCICFEEGAANDTASHSADAGGCYDIAPNAAGVYEHLLGGEACLWGNVQDGPYNSSEAFRHLWPGGLAVAERLWSAREVADWRRAAPRLEAQLGRLERRGRG